ncbi:MAG: hypothetical protein KBB55_04220 [Candidatus Buchananbacteria bacterium]|nr:hypothetical protein [Candidatus Buchananbacteria bacterium]
MAIGTKQEHAALDAFLNLLSLITVGWWSLALGGVLFQIVDKFFGVGFGPVYNYSQSGLKFGIASLIIVTPVLVWVNVYLRRLYQQERLSSTSAIHRWLTYAMLLVSALVIVGDLIAVIYSLLNGDYTIASMLKIAVILVISAGIFGYFWVDLRRQDFSLHKPLALTTLAVVILVSVAAIIGSLFVIDSPKVTREKNADNERVNHLSQINSQIVSQYYEQQVLPADLSELNFADFKDPETQAAYEYRVISAKEYELCATFNRAVDTGDNSQWYGYEKWYHHGAGRQCFTENAPVVSPDTMKRTAPLMQ